MITEGKTKKKNDKGLILNIVGIFLCIILLPILIVNCILIVKGAVNKDQVPTLGGYAPLIVLSGSMDPDIKEGDMIIVKIVDTDDLEEGMYISYYDPDSSNSSIVTHAIEKKIVDPETGEVSFETKGINNDLDDKTPVPAENVIGVYVTRIGTLGYVALFMQSTPGLIVCVVLPLAAFITSDIIRRKKNDKAKQSDMDKLRAELEALKAAQNVSIENQKTDE